jgi:hypothetical protein
LFAKLQAKHGTVLVVIDQPASIGVLPVAVARDMGCPVAYLPGLTMRRIADLYPGEAKTDAKDAFIIADAARAMPPPSATASAASTSHTPPVTGNAKTAAAVPTNEPPAPLGTG